MHPVIRKKLDAHPDARLPAPQTVAQAFLDSVERFGTRPAVKPLDAPALSYAELAQQVRTAVAVLQRLGLRPGDRLAICLPNGVGWPVFTYAAAMLGLCVVPINLRYRTDELAAALKGSSAAALVTQSSFMSNAFVGRLREIAGGGALGEGDVARIAALPDLKRIVFTDGTKLPGSVDYRALAADLAGAAVDLQALARARQGTDAMWMFWTSGTTSAPKGALLPQSAIDIVWKWTALVGYRPDDRVLMSRPLFYIAGQYWCMLAPMLRGALAVVGAQLSATEIQQLCRQEQVTVLSGNPIMMKSLIEQGSFDADAFAHVRLGYFGGSSLSVDEMRAIRKAIGYQALVQTYGMTELGGFATSTLPEDPIEVACASCGYAFTDMEYKLVHPESGEPVPAGEMGLLLTRGQPLIDYVNLPDAERAKVFDADGWFRTGDLVRLQADGRYAFAGRFKDLIKVGGENVTAAEIEAALMKHPDVTLASVIGTADPARGEVPVAFIELKSGTAADAVAFLAWCKSRMAPYKVPARLCWIAPGAWPMTVTGKIAKHELHKLARAP